jgi:electron transfer flavoprotein beta subunit
VLKSLQMGADAGVHVVDDAIHGSDSVGTSRVLAAALARRAPDIVVCGMASTDGSMGVVPAMLAERLGLPQLTFASEVVVDGQTVRIRRDGDSAVEIVEATLPVVLSVTDQCNEPRYPSFKQIMAAKRKPVETLSLSDLGIAADQVGLDAAWTAVTSSAERPPRGAGTVVTDTDGSGASALVEFLVGQKLI